jgi:hypothetical protein
MLSKTMLSGVCLGDQIRRKCSRFGSMLARVARSKLWKKLTPISVVSATKTSAAAARPGDEYEVSKRLITTVAAALSHALTRYMYDFQNDRPLAAGVWQKTIDPPL